MDGKQTLHVGTYGHRSGCWNTNQEWVLELKSKVTPFEQTQGWVRHRALLLKARGGGPVLLSPGRVLRRLQGAWAVPPRVAICTGTAELACR